MIGQTISHYKISEKLGEGGMGVVYKAYDTKLKRSVALKFLSRHLLADEQQRKRFIHEAQAAAGLTHPHICTVHEIHEADGHTFMVMEYIEGESLGHKIESEALDVGEALDVAIQVGKGLSKAHDQGIVHRDIKPGNVLMTPEGDAKIVDFGLAKLAAQTRLTKTGATVGTVMYMSPEQAKGGDVDHRTDIWSVGVMLYEMLTGKLPFRGEIEHAVVYSIMNEDPEPITSTRKDVPIALEELVEKALAKDPEKRYATVDEFLTDLEEERDRLTLGIKERRFAALRRLRRRKRLTIGVAAVVVVVLAAVLVQTFYEKGALIDSIAVIPLENLSGDPDQELLVDGITGDLIRSLSQVSGFEAVISRASVIGYKGTDKSPKEIATELNVKAFVAGTVQPVGDRIKVAVELVHAATGKNLWTAAFEEDPRKIQKITNEVARTVVGEIGIELTPQEETQLARSREVDPEAREAYQLGRHFFNMQMADKVRLSIEQFNRAIEIDPDYALAYFGLADSWVSLGQLDPEVPWGEGLEKGEEFALKALEIDSTLAEAHAKLGEMLVETAFDWEAAEKRYEKALRFNPNSATAHVYYHQLLSMLHRHDEAIDHALRARKNDPLSQFIAANVIWSYQIAGRNDEALEAYRRAVELDPDNPVIHWAGACTYIAMRQYEEALALLHKGASVPEVDAFIAYCQARLGRRAEAEAYLEGKDESIMPGDFAVVYMGLGMEEKVLEFFNNASYGPGLAWLQINPIYQDLFSDPRFRELMREKNFPGY